MHACIHTYTHTNTHSNIKHEQIDFEILSNPGFYAAAALEAFQKTKMLSLQSADPHDPNVREKHFCAEKNIFVHVL